MRVKVRVWRLCTPIDSASDPTSVALLVVQSRFGGMHVRYGVNQVEG